MRVVTGAFKAVRRQGVSLNTPHFFKRGASHSAKTLNFCGAVIAVTFDLKDYLSIFGELASLRSSENQQGANNDVHNVC
jgi:hypothetical protein